MQQKTVSIGVVESSSKKSLQPIPFSPSQANSPALIDHLIADADVFATNMLFGSHLATNAQTLQQTMNNVIAEWGQKTLSYLSEIMRSIPPEKMIGDKPAIIVCMELLRKEEVKSSRLLPTTDELEGYRILYFVNDKEFKPAEVMKKMWNELPTRKEECFHKEINSFGEYLRLVGAKNGASPLPMADQLKLQNMEEEKCAVSPRYVFSIRKACETARGVCKAQRDPDSYQVIEGARLIKRIPFPELTVRLTDTEMQYKTLSLLQLPTELSLKQYSNITHPDYSLWEKLTSVEEDSLPPDECEKDFSPGNETFRTIFGSHQIAQVGVSAGDLCLVNNRKRAKIEAEHQKSLAEGVDAPEDIQNRFCTKMDTFYKEGLDSFRHLWNPYANVSSYLKKCIEWMEKYVQDHHTMYNPISRFSLDMSTTNEFILSFLTSAEVLLDSSSCHTNMFRCMIALHDASANELGDKFHWLAIGDAAVSKSHVLKKVEEMAVPGMVETMTYKTNKSDAVGGNFDESCEMFHEVPYGWLGVNQAGKTDMPTEQEQMAKEVMTSGKMRLKEVYFNETKDRCVRKITADKNCTYIMATNLKKVKSEFLDRCYADKFNQVKREGRSITDLMCAPLNFQRKQLKAQMIERYRWFHAMNTYLNQLIKAGVMLEAKTPFIDAMLPKILEEARARGITRSSERPRALVRLHAAARVLIKWRAIYLIFCSELSPFKGEKRDGVYQGEPWRPEQMLALQPYLIDSDPAILVSLLGLLRSDFDEESRYMVIEGARRCDRLGGAPSAAAQGGGRKITVSEDVEKLYYVVNNVFQNGLKDFEKREILAARWRLSMNPIPQKGEVAQQLEEMGNQFKDVDMDDGPARRPIFELDNQGYRILKEVVTNNKPHRLEDAVKAAMEHSQTVPAVHLFGTDLENLEPCDLKRFPLQQRPKVLELNNLDYYDSRRLDMIRGSYSGTIEAAFSNEARTQVLNQPLEEKQFYEHVFSIGWTEKRLLDLDIMPERFLKRKLVALGKDRADEYAASYEELKRNGMTEPQIIAKIGLKPPPLRHYDPAAMRRSRLQPPPQQKRRKVAEVPQSQKPYREYRARMESLLAAFPEEPSLEGEADEKSEGSSSPSRGDLADDDPLANELENEFDLAMERSSMSLSHGLGGKRKR